MGNDVDEAVNGNAEEQDASAAAREDLALTRRNELAGITTIRSAETAMAASAAFSEASVRARYAMALQRRRSFDDVRVKLLTECKRYEFADAARYELKFGQEPVQGLTIRFAEAAARAMGNLFIEASLVFEDSRKLIYKVAAVDLESNHGEGVDVTVEKTVERRKPKRGQVILGQRENSYGDIVSIVEANATECLMKSNALVARARRQLIIHMLPGDILRECEKQIDETLRTRITKDPAAFRKAIVDSFASINVMPSALNSFLGHDLAESSPAELEQLRGVYRAIESGVSTWADVIEAAGRDGAEEPKSGAKKVATLDEIVARGKAAKAAKDAATKATDKGAVMEGARVEPVQDTAAPTTKPVATTGAAGPSGNVAEAKKRADLIQAIMDREAGMEAGEIEASYAACKVSESFESWEKLGTAQIEAVATSHAIITAKRKMSGAASWQKAAADLAATPAGKVAATLTIERMVELIRDARTKRAVEFDAARTPLGIADRTAAQIMKQEQRIALIAALYPELKQ